MSDTDRPTETTTDRFNRWWSDYGRHMQASTPDSIMGLCQVAYLTGGLDAIRDTLQDSLKNVQNDGHKANGLHIW